MKKLSVLLVAFVTFTACNSATSNDNQVRISGGGFSAEKEQEDLREFLNERSRYNTIFKSVKSDIANIWDSMLDIFGDYVVEDMFAESFLSADMNDSLSFGGYSDNDSEFYY